MLSEGDAVRVLRVPAPAVDGLIHALAELGFDAEELPREIRTPGRVIDPTSASPAESPFTAGLFIVQYAAPATPAWQAALHATGAVTIEALPARATVVTATREAAAALARLPWIDYVAPYTAADKFAPAYEPPTRTYNIQIASTDLSQDAIEDIKRRVGGLSNVTVANHRLTARMTCDFAAARAVLDEPFVLGVEAYAPSTISDERAAYAATGASTTTGDYLAWLQGRGITPSALTNSGISVDVADTGVEVGCAVQGFHPDFGNRFVYFGGTTGSSSLAPYKDTVGHGTIVAGVIAANGDTGTRMKDATSAGRYYGMGVAPGVKLGSTRIIAATGAVGTVAQWTTLAITQNCQISTTRCSYTTTACPATVQTHSHNQYDDAGTYAGIYSSMAQQFDVSVRDADHSGSRTTALPITISAGNYNQNAADLTRLVLPPATAKNVVSMGAVESRRPDIANCNTSAGGTHAVERNSADGFDYVAFCSRRGTVDGRIKPDLLAPATLIFGPRPVNLSVGYCGEASDASLSAQSPYSVATPQYKAASGTSFAAPFAAGAIALLRYYYQTHFGLSPSPALYKAMLIAGARSITGAPDRLEQTVPNPDGDLTTGPTVQRWPNKQQGFGVINLDTLLATTPVRAWHDQQTILTQGQAFTRQITVNDPTKSLRVVLAWTDKEGAVQSPGTTYQNVIVNDLDLTATWSDGTKYYGNLTDTVTGYSKVWACGRPSCGWPNDRKNNIEVLNVDPARFSTITNRTFTVQVTAFALNGIAVPGQSVNTQDFALFILNGNMQ